nr:hypothetical protein [Tanacetum cinerariifolium]
MVHLPCDSLQMAYYNKMHRHSDPYDWANPARHERYSFIDKIPFNKAPRMLDRLIHRDDGVTGVPLFYYGMVYQASLKDWKPYKEPTLIKLHEVMCKAEDDIRIIARNKTNKCSAKDKENDEQTT